MDNQNNQQNNNPNIIQPNTTYTPSQPIAPTPPTGQPVIPSQPLPNAPLPPKKSKKALWIILVLILVVTAAAAAYFLLVVNKDQSTDKDQTSQSTSDDKTQSTELKITSYSAHESSSDDPIAITLEHPANWKVEQEEDGPVEPGSDYTVRGKLTITSSQGNTVEITDASFGGVGGDCGEEINLQLIKKLTTKEDNFVFIENKYSGEGASKEQRLVLNEVIDPATIVEDEAYSEDLARYNALKEGESFTGNSCVTFSYPFIKSQDGLSIIQVRLPRSEDETKSLAYDDIKDDTEFIAMLQSLDIKN